MRLKPEAKMKTLLVSLIFLATSSAFAGDKYECHVFGEHINSYNERAEVSAQGLVVEVDASSSTKFGRQEEPEHEWDSRPEVMPWSLSIRNERDGGEQPLVLTLRAPNQNAAVGFAYADKGAKYIGLIIGSRLEALCKKL